MRLDAGAYGKLCTIVPPLMDALQSTLVGDMAEAVWSLRDTGGRPPDAASGYQSTDEDNAASAAGAGFRRRPAGSGGIST